MIVAVDTTVVVAALSSWHEHHEAAARNLNDRIAPTDALRILSNSFRKVRLVALSSAAVWPLLENLAGESIGGGRVYDAAIMLAAREAGADAILTFNTKHFDVFGIGMRVMAPE